MSAEKAWTTIKELARYEDEGWNDPIFPDKRSLNYTNSNMEQLLRIMECLIMSKRTRHGNSTKGQSSSSRKPTMEDMLKSAIPSTGPNGAKPLQTNKPVYLELVPEVLCSIEFEATAYRYDPEHLGISSRLGGESRKFSLFQFSSRVRELMDALSFKPRTHIFKKKSLITIGIIVELNRGECYWPVTRQVGEDDEVEEAAEKGAGGSSEVIFDEEKPRSS
ncbi:hypothetical protein Tco_0267462 [Tanacetum coccineum]